MSSKDLALITRANLSLLIAGSAIVNLVELGDGAVKEDDRSLVFGGGGLQSASFSLSSEFIWSISHLQNPLPLESDPIGNSGED